jgi:hypothetical protein
LLKKRLLSAPSAFATTLAKHRTLLLAATRPASGARLRRPNAGILKTMLTGIEDEYSNDDEYSTALFQPPTAAE